MLLTLVEFIITKAHSKGGCKMFSFFQKKITSVELEFLLKSKEVVLIDVRESAEYQQSHIMGSSNVPLGALATNIQKKFKNKNQKIVVHCLSGGRSAQAKKILQKLGYENVEDFGGIHRYHGSKTQG